MPSQRPAHRRALVAQPHANGNGPLNVARFSSGSDRRLRRLCSEGHKCEARVELWGAGYGCPYCPGRLAAPETSLAAVAPAVAAQRHAKRNSARRPETTMPGPDRLVWWQCEQGQEWQAAINDRVGRAAGCRYCAGKRAFAGRSPADLHPRLAADLDPNRALK
jgi:DNA-directed RNA polymerase subunit RPC12/RpoP